ncbi:MAG: type II toxin-antitoxin system HicB family antitoxin, partial [Nitrospirota bacterium]|nr:type II toxin-antitoxin system HicB family antitoxin [Nitrospirota bacterium]
MKVLNYRILLIKEPEGGYTVIVPSLSGCVTYGDTIEEARTHKIIIWDSADLNRGLSVPNAQGWT